MKYRSKQNKIKQEHSMIKGLKDFLSEIHQYDEIHSMIPGPIKPVKKAVPKIKLRSITPTVTGLKVIIQSGAAVQEVFFVGEQDKMMQILQQYK